MHSEIDPGELFALMEAGCENDYFGRDDQGNDMWQHDFEISELDAANKLLNKFGMEPADIISIGRISILSELNNHGHYFAPKEIVSVSIQRGKIYEIFMLTKSEESKEIVAEKDVQIDGDYTDLLIALDALARGHITDTDLEEREDEMHLINVTEMSVIAGLAKILKKD